MLKMKKIEELFKEITSFLFICLVYSAGAISITALIVGAMSSIILLYKLFPEISIIIIKPFLVMSRIYIKIITTLIILISMFALMYLISWLFEKGEESKIKREINREKFLNDLAKKLNKQRKKG